MHVESFQLWLLIGGLAFSIFGGLVLFSRVFPDLLYRTWWKRDDLARKLLPGNSGYFFDRYGRGLGSFILGILMLLSPVISWIDLETNNADSYYGCISYRVAIYWLREISCRYLRAGRCFCHL